MLSQIDIGDYIDLNVSLDAGLLIFFGNMEEVDELGRYLDGFIVEVVLLQDLSVVLPLRILNRKFKPIFISIQIDVLQYV
jgi:hypothetical protein